MSFFNSILNQVEEAITSNDGNGQQEGGGIASLLGAVTGQQQQQQQASQDGPSDLMSQFGGGGALQNILGALQGQGGGSGNLGGLLQSFASAGGGGGGQLGALAGLASLAGLVGGGGGGASSGSTTGNPMLDQIIDGAFGGKASSREIDPNSKFGYVGKTLLPSDITGKRRALFVGINYTGSNNALRGCINDVRNVMTFFLNRFKFDEFMVLTDEDLDPSKQPTRATMLAAMQWLVNDARPGDSFFFHYSGHGSQTKDLDGDEPSGMDGCLCPLDYAEAGMIMDDDINAIMVQPLPEGCQFLSILDCCHSGSMLDLPYTYSVNGKLELEVKDNRAEAAKQIIGAGMKFVHGKKGRALGDAVEGVKMLMSKEEGNPEAIKRAQEKTEKMKGSRATCWSFSGCKDSQTSADASFENKPSGAMSYALLQVLNQNQQISYLELLKEIRGVLKRKFNQIAQLSTGYPCDVNVPFFL